MIVVMAEVAKKKIGKTEGRGFLKGEGGAGEYVYEPIYEEIEAPRFVDFIAPDSYEPGGDRYWFCSRVGCDQKHEEEIDSETIWKNFVLKVMAARSPNVRLRKALSRKPPNVAAKCPQSAPAKPLRLRTSRLALLSSSVSRKIAFSKEGTEPALQKPKTPSNKDKRIAAASQALTTPRNRAQVSKQRQLKSVGNSKAKTNLVKSKMVAAKALDFPSPRKIKGKTTTLELKTSTRNICEGMKKLELGTPRKNILGYEKSSPSAGSKKRLAARAVRSRVYDSFRPQNPKGNADAKYPGGLKMKQTIRNELKERSDSGESSDMEVEGKSNRGSVEGFDGASTNEKDATNPETAMLTKTENVNQELCHTPLEASRSPAKLDLEENRKDESIPIEAAPSMAEIGEGKENEVLDTDDKENAMAPDHNREQKDENKRKDSTSIKKPDIHPKTQKVRQIRSRTSKENAAVEKQKAYNMKQTKPKPTNPKPFRLRTDERGILREANLEKKKQTVPKDLEVVSKNWSTNLPQSRTIASIAMAQGNDNEKKSVRMPNDPAMVNDTSSGGCQNEGKKPLDKSCSREGPGPKIHRKPVISLQLRRSKDNNKRNKFVGVKHLERHRKALASKPGATEGSPAAVAGKKEPENTRDDGGCASSATKAANPLGELRSLPRGKNTLTIPKEPHFHEIHVPKSCTRKVN